MGIIEDTLAKKQVADLEDKEDACELTEDTINAVVEELRKGTAKGPYTDISTATGVCENDVKAIHEAMNNRKTELEGSK